MVASACLKTFLSDAARCAAVSVVICGGIYGGALVLPSLGWIAKALDGSICELSLAAFFCRTIFFAV